MTTIGLPPRWAIATGCAMAALSHAVTAQAGAGRDAQPTLAVAAARFEFRSDFRMNLHDFLYFVARRDTTVGVSTVEQCPGPVAEPQREGWLRAVRVYVDSLAQLGAFDRPLIDIRFVLSGLPGHGMTMPRWTARAMSDAEPVYRSCVWSAQDERNRTWVNDVIPLIERFEAGVVSELERLYGVDWGDRPILVDLVRYVSRQGANTVTNPDHIVVSTSDEDFNGYGGLEMVFHEASHTLIGRRRGPVAQALNAAATELDTRLHRDLWHVVLFYTTGMTVRSVLRDEVGIDYEPYIYSTGLFDRAWPELKDAVEQHWTPYVEGRDGLEKAAHALVGALANR